MIKTLYICFRHPDSTGYPKETKKAISYLFDSSEQLKESDLLGRLKVLYYRALIFIDAPYDGDNIFSSEEKSYEVWESLRKDELKEAE